jgi:hypothetical protein
LNYLFISYLNRSGSTFLANLLSRSQEVCVCPEAEILYKLFLTRPTDLVPSCFAKNFVKVLNKDNKFRWWKITIDTSDLENKSHLECFFIILNKFRTLHYPASRFIVFKHNYLLNLIEEDFTGNQVFFVNLIRDPKSIFASQKVTISPATQKPMCRNPISFADSWNFYLARIKSMESNLNVASVYFEDLISTTDAVMEKLFDFAGIEDSWNTAKGNLPQLSPWISEEYKNIHKYIDEKPIVQVNEKWKTILMPLELGILARQLKFVEKYNTDSPEMYFKANFWYEIYLRFGRKIQYIRGIKQQRKFNRLIRKPC